MPSAQSLSDQAFFALEGKSIFTDLLRGKSIGDQLGVIQLFINLGVGIRNSL